MMELTVSDNSSISKQEFEKIPKLTDKIANKTLEKLEEENLFIFPGLIKDSKDITEEQMILQRSNANYQTGNIVGFLGLEAEKLTIKSRFSQEGQDYFLQYMLEKVLDFPNLLNLEANMDQDEKIHSLLIFLFPKYLKAALSKNLYKTYVQKCYNDANLRGALDLARHIKINSFFTGKLAYKQREFSFDNAVTELIRHTIEYIKLKPFAKQVMPGMTDALTEIQEITESYRLSDRRKIIDENIKHPVRHAFYSDYRALQRLCLAILQHDKHNIGKGENQIHGILFDAAWLWEEYLNTILKRDFIHPENRKKLGRIYIFENKKGGAYPDFYSKDKRIVLDAKYKRYEDKAIGRGDLYQIISYLHALKAEEAGVISPSKQRQTQEFSQGELSGFGGEIFKYLIQIPNDAEDYIGFSEAMKVEEELLLRNYKKKLEGKEIG